MSFLLLLKRIQLQQQHRTAAVIVTATTNVSSNLIKEIASILYLSFQHATHSCRDTHTLSYSREYFYYINVFTEGKGGGLHFSTLSLLQCIALEEPGHISSMTTACPWCNTQLEGLLVLLLLSLLLLLFS